jgi:hypothetical protein
MPRATKWEGSQSPDLPGSGGDFKTVGIRQSDIEENKLEALLMNYAELPRRGSFDPRNRSAVTHA